MKRILIVEDQKEFAEHIARLIEPLQRHFPGSVIDIVTSLPEALNKVRQIKPLSVILLDLTLPPHNMDETIAELDTFEKAAPVVIVTGHAPEMVAKKLSHPVDIIWKGDLGMPTGAGILHRAIARAMRSWHSRMDNYDEQRARIAKIEELANAGT